MFSGNSIGIEEDKESIHTQFSLLTRSELYEFRYDPGYGSNVPLLLHKPANVVTEGLIQDALYDQQMFCPNVVFSRDQIVLEKTAPAQYKVNIQATIDLNAYVTDIQLLLDIED